MTMGGRRMVDRGGLLCAAVAFAAYYNTLDAGFVYDDTRAILQNDDIRPDAPLANLLVNDFWGTPLSHSGSHKSFRPLTTATFRLNYALSRGNARSYHLFNVALHALATYLFVLYARTATVLLPGRTGRAAASVLSGLMFALHPVHTEAVAGVVGRAEVLSAVFFFAALLSYHRHVKLRGRRECGESGRDRGRGSSDPNGNVVLSKKVGSGKATVAAHRETAFLGLTVALAALAMFSKEQGVTVLGVCFLNDLLRPTSRLMSGGEKRRSLVTLAVSVAALLALRARVMGFSPPHFARADNPASAEDSATARALTFLFLPAFNLWLLLCPSRLSFDWSMDAVPVVRSLADGRNLATLAFYSALGAAFVKRVWPLLPGVVASCQQGNPVASRSNRLAAACLALMALPFLPASNLFFYVGFVVAERVLYVPSAGFCLLSGCGAAMALSWARGRGPAARSVVPALLLCALVGGGLRTVRRNRDWADEEGLYRSGIQINPPKAYGNLANVLAQRGRVEEAEVAFKKALQHRPNMADAHYNLGVLYQRQHRLSEAIECYTKAIHFRHKLVLAHLNLGLVYSGMGQKSRAFEIFSGILSIGDDGLKDPRTHTDTQVSALANMGRIELGRGRPAEAVAVLRRAEAMARPIGPTGRCHECQTIFNLMADAFQALNRTDWAEHWYREALRQKPDHVPAYLKYGKMLAKNKTRHSEAEFWFSKARALAPDDGEVHLHYGMFLLDADRNSEAAQHFAIAAKANDKDEKGGDVPNEHAYEATFNAAVAFRQAGDNERAEEFYRRAVALRPEDASSLMNLGACLHLVGKLAEAEEQYAAAWRLSGSASGGGDGGRATLEVNVKRLHNAMRKKGLRTRRFEP